MCVCVCVCIGRIQYSKANALEYEAIVLRSIYSSGELIIMYYVDIQHWSDPVGIADSEINCSTLIVVLLL